MRWYVMVASLALVGCGGIAPSDSAFYNHGGPEHLLDRSTEVVSVNLSDPQEVKGLAARITKEKPDRAELSCVATDKPCAEAKAALARAHIPAAEIPSQRNLVVLYFDRIVARDCDPRYLDGSHDFHWTNQPEWGCSVASNMVQHASDKSQFTNPRRLGDIPATEAAAGYLNAYRNQARQQSGQGSYSLEQSTLSQAATSGGN